MSDLLKCGKAPCKSCPYRRDVPSGLWAANEYEKLPGYDGEIMEQMIAGAVGVFMCHQQDGKLCAGWVAAHGANKLAAMRLQGGRIDESVWDYKSPVPVFASGREAAEHGLRDVAAPGPRADKVIARLVGKQRRRARYGK